MIVIGGAYALPTLIRSALCALLEAIALVIIEKIHPLQQTHRVVVMANQQED
jgi:hypothetical protein